MVFRATWRTSQSKPKKKKIHSEKSSLYFRKWNFLALILKKFLYFRKWNPALSGLNPQDFFPKNFLLFFLKNPTLKKFIIFSYIFRNGTQHFSPQARKVNEIHPRKIFHTSGKGKKISYIFPKERCSYVSGNGSPDGKLQSLKIKQKNLLVVCYDVFSVFATVEHREIRRLKHIIFLFIKMDLSILMDVLE